MKRVFFIENNGVQNDEVQKEEIIYIKEEVVVPIKEETKKFIEEIKKDLENWLETNKLKKHQLKNFIWQE